MTEATAEERRIMRDIAATHAATRLEDALSRHGIIADPETNEGYIGMEFTPPAANALADWLNEVADAQRPRP